MLNRISQLFVLPYQELLGNYNIASAGTMYATVLPYQELLGNYNSDERFISGILGFTIPRTVRELQLDAETAYQEALFYHTKNC